MGTCLTAEENFHLHFLGRTDSDHKEARNQSRYDLPREPAVTNWHRFFDRWDTNKSVNEPNRFGWIVEVDPYDAESTPVKRTALGRFAHEGVAVQVSDDGRIVIYMADDKRNEYLYRFVSDGRDDPSERKSSFGLLDEGTLSVAAFTEDGKLRWLPLQYGRGKINENNGFYGQADVMIEMRSAGDLVGATPLDHPEGIAISPVTGGVCVTFSGNKRLKPDETNAPNPRPGNIWGHIIELLPPEGDHTAGLFDWEVLVLCGPPADESVAARWNSAISAHGWFSGPDNCAFDNSGGLWVCTDQSRRWKKASEATGPAFTPDNESLFLSVQYPGGEGTQDYAAFGRRSTFSDPATRWPDFDPGLPPRSSVVAITRKKCGRIGT